MGKAHKINSHLVVPSAGSFCSVYFLQHCICCLPFATPPMPGTAGECNLWSAEDHLGDSGATEQDTNLWCCHVSQWATCNSHQYNAWKRKNSCQRRNQSSESKFVCSVEGVCQCCCSSLGEQACGSLVFFLWSIRTFMCFCCDQNGDLSHNTCVCPSRESQNQLWHGENNIWLSSQLQILAFHSLCVTVPFIWM